MKTIQFNQKQIAYTKEGSGHCLVLLHGFPMDSRVWNGFRRELASSFCVITPDLPGFGRSEMIEKRHDMFLMADAVAAILKAEQVSSCVMAGHSMGGYVALAFAKSYPQLLSGFVLFHSHATADDEATRENRNKAILSVIHDKKDFVSSFIDGLFEPAFFNSYRVDCDAVKAIALSQSEDAIVAALAGMRERESHIELLTKVKVPVLFILGKNDSRMPVVKIMAQAGLPAHAELMMLDGVGHMGFLEAKLATRHAIASFAERCFLLKSAQ